MNAPIPINQRLARNSQYELDHLCRNHACINPDHLEAVTHDENMRRYADAVIACKWGHEYTPENTYWSKRGTKVCRTCALARQARKPRAA